MALVYPEAGVDYPGESDHKIFPITTNPEIHPSRTRPCYGVITSDYDILFNLIMNLPRLIVTAECKNCPGARCKYKNTIARDIVVHMKTAYSHHVKGKDGQMVEAEEPRRVFKVMPLYRAIYGTLRSASAFMWMDYPLNTVVFLSLLCASKTDYCDGLPGIGPKTLFDRLAEVSENSELCKFYRNMVVVEPLTYIGTSRSIVSPAIDLDKVRAFVIDMYTQKHATLLKARNVMPDVHTGRLTLDQIHTADTAAHTKVFSIGETHFKTVLNNAIWNFKYVFNGFVDAGVYRSNCIELDSTGNPKYGWKNKGEASSLGASHHINSAFITNDF